jgi:hypothetical protein
MANGQRAHCRALGCGPKTPRVVNAAKGDSEYSLGFRERCKESWSSPPEAGGRPVLLVLLVSALRYPLPRSDLRVRPIAHAFE